MAVQLQTLAQLPPSPSSFAPPPSRHLPLRPPPPPRTLPSPKLPLSTSTATATSSSSPPFDQSPLSDVITWTATIADHSRRGRHSDAVASFAGMLSAGVQPNHITLVTLLSSCADFPSSPSALLLGRAVHAHALKRPPPPDAAAELVVLATAIVDMYAKCGRPDLAAGVFERMPAKNSVSFNTMMAGYMKNGDVERAASLFDRVPRKDKISWTVMIDGCVKNGFLEEALQYFRAMQLDGIGPDYVTVISVVAACANLGALGHGLWVHRYAMLQAFSSNVRIANSLIDMYSRCGRVDFAHQVFGGMTKRTLVSWNSMIVGFAVNGCCLEALEHFDSMRMEGFVPDGVTFTGVLSACSHGGFVDEGLKLYDLMTKGYRIRARIEHYGCMVDLLSRAGRLEEAMLVVERMPMRPNEVVLGSLLAACREHGNVALAERVMAYLVELRPDCDSNYVLLSNVYATVGRWEGVGEVRNTMKAIGLKKQPGFSGVEIDCDVHEFVAGDKFHPQSDDIYEMLNLVHHEMELYGYEITRIPSLSDD